MFAFCFLLFFLFVFGFVLCSWLHSSFERVVFQLVFLGLQYGGYTAASRIFKIFMMSLCVGMNGHLSLGLCIWSRLLWFRFGFGLVCFLFTASYISFLIVTKTSFAMTCLYVIFGLMEKNQHGYQVAKWVSSC